jgi:hypothetical protein
VRIFLVGLAGLLVGCSNPHDTPLPKDLAGMESIKPAIEKLPAAERELVAGYIVRHTLGASLGAAFGVKTDPIPDGMTIGRAITEQREFVEKLQAEEAARKSQEAVKKAARDKARAERAALAVQMKALIGVRLTHLSLHKATFRDGDVKSRINLVFEFENKGTKDITGIKGIATFKDTFGDTVATVPFKVETQIAAGKMTSTRLGKDYNQFNDADRKLADLEASKVVFDLDPEVVLFADGSKFEAPNIAKAEAD